MGPGGTESVIHTDSHDNLNCVFAGSKRFYIADSAYYGIVTDKRCGWVEVEEEVKEAAKNGELPMDEAGNVDEEEVRKKFGYGAFSKRINVSAVDLLKYPCWANIPYQEATLYPGDCLFIPQYWIHHVASDGGEDSRSIATNLWWSRPEKYDPQDCVASFYGDSSPIPASDCEFYEMDGSDSAPSFDKMPPCHPSRGRKHKARSKQEL